VKVLDGMAPEDVLREAARKVASMPPLLDPLPCGTPFQGLDPAAADLLDGAELARSMEHAPARLGRRFEQLVGALLQADPRWEVRASGLQVTGADGATAGEFDFVLYSIETATWVHLECACKLYLGDGRSRAHRDWRGPNPTDTLAGKLETLRRQTSLARTPAGRAALYALGFDGTAPLTSEVLLVGWFFVPFNRLGTAALPSGAHRNVPTGWWCTFADLPAVVRDGPSVWLDLGGTAGLLAPGLAASTPLDAAALRASLAPDRTHYLAQMLLTDDGPIELSRGVVLA
jgi:hypothetical protein